ncbi:hypothetical protein IB286_11005 [Spongiibacter sp. KMU-158]|uniref:DUF1302 domain-containing protein n=1 Tax=Spongiibacter pelagi TaxID=2760804 RepID=A0A927GWW2_9GAMM|nr:hypothetical protein [Spongiibacter pelagi]MBD2859533.1 hypothetical protein [Spongiibacter pelagi]
MNTYKTTLLVAALALQSSVITAEDFLGGGDFDFDSSEIETQAPHWTDGFKTTLAHNHTQVPGDINREQSSLQIEFERNLAEGWYLQLDSRYRYFWHEDDFAENRGDAYHNIKWQRASIQYSQGACTATLGRQGLIWGSVEGTFVTDIVTPFDYTEQLLTDYGTVRLHQDMLVGECFSGKAQLQAFYTPEAKNDIYQHHPLQITLAPGAPPLTLDADPDEEFGLRFKWHGSGFDLSLMAARLFDNTPTPVFLGPTSGFEAQLAQFNMLGAASSVAVGRLLIKAEAAYRSQQITPISGDKDSRADVALGFEFTTRTNHMLNGGIWAARFQDQQAKQQDFEVLTVGWRKTYLNDDLTMSLLGNRSSEPKFSMVTVLADYQWNDYLSTSFALTLADLNSTTPIPIAPAEESATLSIKYEF